MTNAFTQMPLHPQVVQAVTELGYRTPTAIQAAVIPCLLAGRDVIGQAHTGTGKTAAFSLPILHAMVPGQRQVQGLVVAPTRELAIQVAQAMHAYGRYRRVRVLAIYGGQPYGQQIDQLKKGLDIVVGTPGRLLDLMQRTVLDLSQVRTVVLDEADEMLSMGFIEDIEALLQATPPARQTALFSATLPPEIRRLADRYMRQAQSVTMQHHPGTVATIEQRYYVVNEADKLAALTRLFEVEDITSALIFARTRAGTSALAQTLTTRGFASEALHGDLSQQAREQVLQRFRSNQTTVLVATDVAARGLDIEGISHVFNYDPPHDPEGYVHRVGRTGRAGNTGMAISLLTPKEQWRWRKIEAYTQQKMTPASLPTIEDIQAHREAQMLQRMRVWLKRGRCSRERAMVTELAAAGYTPEDIAATALKLARAAEKQRPLAPIRQAQPVRSQEARRERVRGNRGHGGQRANGEPERGMQQLTLGVGKVHGVRPGDVVGTIAYHANIPGHSIGAIRVREQHTLVDVPEQFVAQVLANAGRLRIHQQAVTIAEQ
ncbi:DEAD-box ATP-dependent RNA helicase CshA [Candidatus Entotheonellaceae bacterium PAL068K]